MDGNIVQAVFGKFKECSTDSIYQWSYGQVLQFVGINLPSSYEVHFSNDEYYGESKTQIGNENGVTIPDEYITAGRTIYAWIFLHSGADDGETVYKIKIPMKKRPEPIDEEPTPVEQSTITQAIVALTDGVTRSEAAADSAESSKRVAVDSANRAESYSSIVAANAQIVEDDTAYVRESRGVAQELSETVQENANSASANAIIAQSSKNEAVEAAESALNSEDLAREYCWNAEDSAESALTYANQAKRSATNAADSEDIAVNNASYAIAAKNQAESARDSANRDAQSTNVAYAATVVARDAARGYAEAAQEAVDSISGDIENIDELKNQVNSSIMYNDAMGEGITNVVLGRQVLVRKNFVDIKNPSGNSSSYKFCNIFGMPEINKVGWNNADLSNDYFCPLGFEPFANDLIICVEWDHINETTRNRINIATKNNNTGVITKKEVCNDKEKKIQVLNLLEIAPEIMYNENFALYALNQNTLYPNSFRYWLHVVKKDNYATSDLEVKKIRAARWTHSESIPPISLLHFSDIHGDGSELTRIVNFYNIHKDILQDAICTGDMRKASVESDFAFWSGCCADNIMVALGNHEYYTSYNDNSKADISTVIQTWMGTYSSNWNVEIEEGNSYYYKDYDASVRLIVLDCNLKNEEGGSEQKEWLSNILQDAKNQDKTVIIACHYVYLGASKTYTNIDTNFTNAFAPSTADSSYNWSPSIYVPIVQDYIDGGGKFVCWLAGHTHADYMSYPTEYPDQLIVTICAATANRTHTKNTTGDLERTENTPTQDAFNIVTIDTENECLKIVRIGADINTFMRRRDMICYNYSTHQFIG